MPLCVGAERVKVTCTTLFRGPRRSEIRTWFGVQVSVPGAYGLVHAVGSGHRLGVFNTLSYVLGSGHRLGVFRV